MEHLHRTAEQLLKSSVSPNTTSTYTTALASFANFRIRTKLSQTWPTPVEHIVLFIASCFERGLASGTIYTYIRGINYFHKMHSWVNISEVFIIKKLLEGCRRCRSGGPDRRAPITPAMLAELCATLPSICYNMYETKMFRAVFVLAFFGLMRV